MARSQKNAHKPLQRQDTIAEQEQQVDSLMTEKQPSKGIMKGLNLDVLLASTLLTLPMLILGIALISMVHMYQMPNQNSTYSTGNRTGIALGSAYYVNISSSRLANISSIASTVSMLLMSAAMVLYSYPLSRRLTEDCDGHRESTLPSPYQLTIMIKLVGGQPLALWSYVKYALGSKYKRIDVVPNLSSTVLISTGFLILTVLNSLADIWFHVSMDPVQYLERILQPNVPTFTPGRGIPQSCLTPEFQRGAEGCILTYMPSGLEIVLNVLEYMRTAENQSNYNQVYLSGGPAVLGPSKPPPDLDFWATSFGSQTSCEMVTHLCYFPSSLYDGEINLDFDYYCNTTSAGLNLNGSFGDWDDGDDEYELDFQYYNDTQKLHQMGGGETPVTQGSTQILWALAFQLQLVGASSGSVDSNNLTNDTQAASFGLLQKPDEAYAGILSCETNLSEITYSFMSGIMTVMDSQPTNASAALPFIAAITFNGSTPMEQLQQGFMQKLSTAKTAEDIAAGFASVYDQTIVALPAGVMTQRPPLNMTRRIETLVTRVPKAPFFALNSLYCLYVILGVCLTIIAVAAVMNDKGVRDAQARLSIDAIVAESFESPAWGDDATQTDELFAERRGQAPRRIGLSRRDGGGRRYKQIVLREVEED